MSSSSWERFNCAFVEEKVRKVAGLGVKELLKRLVWAISICVLSVVRALWTNPTYVTNWQRRKTARMNWVLKKFIKNQQLYKKAQNVKPEVNSKESLRKIWKH